MKHLLLVCCGLGVALAGSGGSLGWSAPPLTEVVVTLKAPPLSAFGRSLTSARHDPYAQALAAAQNRAARNVVRAIPAARVGWRYHIVADGFSVVLPQADVPRLAKVAGVAQVWPSLAYHALDEQGPATIGANQLWGPSLANAGQGMKIAIVDDGIDASHKYFDPSGFSYPPGFPKGNTAYTTPKVIVARAFPPPGSTYKNAALPFDPSQSFHGTHVAGIAAGDHGTVDGDLTLSGVAPAAYLGNYKVLTTPTPNEGLDGNSAEIVAGIEAAVADGMNVVNLSLGEPEIEPSRDIVVQALQAAAAAGVVPVVAAGNDSAAGTPPYGIGSIDSPANAPAAIAVGATTASLQYATFSSVGPTPISLLLKPDVSAPGVGITSALPANQGSQWGTLEGTSMATPQVAGGAALLLQLHPKWTVAQVKSALVQTGDPVHGNTAAEVTTTREGGGEIDLGRASNPLLFAAPTAISFPVNGGTRAVTLQDAGGGAGRWTVDVRPQQSASGIGFATAPSVTVPGRLAVSAHVTRLARPGDYTGFVVLSHGSELRRIPFWVEVSRPALASERHILLRRPGTYTGTTAGGATKVVRYRYPLADGAWPGPEVVYRIRITRRVANFGVAVTSGKAVPHVVYAGDENHLTGYAGLPRALNPYTAGFGDARPIAGAILPLPGLYDIVFDTRSVTAAGPFTFRYWVNDTTPPRLRLARGAPAGTVWLAAVDAGAGVDPASVSATVDGKPADATYADGRIVVRTTPGVHELRVRASDYQEAKNDEDVAAILPNTATFTASVRVNS
ncbi:MAG TPA: S8 family serine peptidase [Gaiellaceae bacterium]|nr:S8 family serine peptidase [Gaiellaceae bacterium]